MKCRVLVGIVGREKVRDAALDRSRLSPSSMVIAMGGHFTANIDSLSIGGRALRNDAVEATVIENGGCGIGFEGTFATSTDGWTIVEEIGFKLIGIGPLDKVFDVFVEIQ